MSFRIRYSSGSPLRSRPATSRSPRAPFCFGLFHHSKNTLSATTSASTTHTIDGIDLNMTPTSGILFLLSAFHRPRTPYANTLPRLFGHRRHLPKLRALLLLHRHQSPGFHESHVFLPCIDIKNPYLSMTSKTTSRETNLFVGEMVESELGIELSTYKMITKDFLGKTGHNIIS